MQKILAAEYGDLFFNKILSEKEKNHACIANSQNRPGAASEIFAMKEAIIKASTKQLTINDLNRIQIEWANQDQMIAYIPGEEERFRVSTSTLGDYILAIAVSEG